MQSLRIVVVAFLVVVFTTACGASSEDVAELESRVDALEQRLAEIDGAPESARSLQESRAPSPTVTDGVPAAAPPAPETEAPANELMALINGELAQAEFLGIEDPEFGGTMVTGDGASRASIRLYRAGLEDRDLLDGLLSLLGFDESAVEAVQLLNGDGQAVSSDGKYSATWTATPEELVVELEAE